MLFSEFLMAHVPRFAAVSLRVTSIDQKDLVGNNTLSCISKETDDRFYFLELIHSRIHTSTRQLMKCGRFFLIVDILP